MTAQDIRFFQTFTYVLAGLVAFTIFIYVLAKVVDGNTQDVWTTSDPAHRAAVEARTAPLGKVALKGEEAVSLAASPSSALTFRETPQASGGDHGEGDDHGADEEHSAQMADDSSHDEEESGEEAMAAAEDASSESEESGSEASMSDPEPAATVADAAPAASGIDGSAVYNQGCVACHGMGIAGAPKVGEASAWSARVDQGKDVLYDHAINGYNAMPAKGGLSFLSDDQVKAAVDYMVGQL